MKAHKKKSQKKLALERIEKLFQQAQTNFKLDPKLSDSYVKLARKIAMKYRVSIPSEYKRQFCKHCYAYFMPGKTCRVRTKNGKLVYSCFKCKKFSRFTYK